jgi:hypothetical protein
MSFRLAIALLASSLTAQAVADETPEARAARYYAEGLERPLLQLRTGAMLIEACKQRLREACDDEQLEPATESHLLTLLDALTLFPQRLDADPGAQITKARDLRKKFRNTSTELLREAGDYDRKVFARFGATLLACPPDEEQPDYGAALETLFVVDLVGFQGMRLDDVPGQQIAQLEESQREAEKWRQLPREDCIAARKVGEYLMQLMHSKLRPWSSPETTVDRQRAFDFSQPKKAEPIELKPAQDRELAHAVAGNFVAVFATELQLMAFPESAARIKEIAERAGFPES